MKRKKKKKKEFWKKKKKKWETCAGNKISGKTYSDVFQNVAISKINAIKTIFSTTFQETSLLICDISMFYTKRRNKVTI